MRIEMKAVAIVLAGAKSIEDVKQGRAMPHFVSPADALTYAQYGAVEIGTATITLELHDDQELHATEILRQAAKLHKMRKEHEAEQNKIIDAINKLQAAQ